VVCEYRLPIRQDKSDTKEAEEGSSKQLTSSARKFMAKIDTLKTAKRCKQAIEMATDGYSELADIRKANRKERQKGKQVIKQELKEYGESQKKKV
jgi:hypothetical protein